MSDRIWITWESQRRNRTLSSRVNARLYEFDLDLPAWRRYPLAAWKTLGCLVREKPRIIFAQNPSLVLAALVIIYAQLRGRKIVIDAHNAGLFPAEGKYRSLNWLASKLFRWTTLTIVSNEELVSHVEGLKGHAIAIPDPIPDLVRPAEVAPLNGAFNVLFICSWAEDEPYLEVLRAAAALDSDIFIYITGNSRGKEQQLGTTLPANVVLTGYLHEQEFNALLFRCDVAMVLTTRDNCLLCGAYEGVAAGKPLLLSDTRALRNYFSKGAVYIENTADLIARGIEDSRSRHASIRQEVAELKNMRNSEYKLLLENLEQQLARL